MAAPSCWVPNDIATKATTMINSSNGATIREGVELLLTNDLAVGGIVLTAAPGRTDAGSILAKGLANIAKYPHQALDLPVGAQTVEIKKAYKKMALKYHPDKNPVGTPIFQAIKTAFDKLADPAERSRAEQAAKRQTPAAAPMSGNRPPPPPPTGAQPFPKAPQENPKQPSNPFHQQQKSSNPNPPPASGGTSSTSQQRPAPQAQPQFSKPTGGAVPPTNGTQANARRDEAYREWARREEEAKRHREEILRKAYFEQNKSDAEKIRKHEEDRKARRATFDNGYDPKPPASSASAKGPTPTPDERSRAAGAGSSSSSSSNGSAPGVGQTGPGVFRSFRPGAYPGSNNAASNGDNQKQSSTAQSQGPQPGRPTPAAAQNPYVGKTFTTDANGNVRMMGGQVPKAANGLNHNSHATSASSAAGGPSSNPNPSKAAQPSGNNASSSASSSSNSSAHPKYSYASAAPSSSSSTSSSVPKASGPTVSGDGVPLFSAKALVPRPFQLKCTSLGSTMVDLEWKLVRPVGVSRPIPVSTYAIELNWRDRARGVHAYNWEAAKQLVSGNTCRKKNLTPGASYDFRIRAVEELAGGMLGGRGEWSEILNVTMKHESPGPTSEKQPTQSTSTAQAHSKPQPEAAQQTGTDSRQKYQYSSKPRATEQPKKTPEPLYSDDSSASEVQEDEHVSGNEEEDVVEEVEEDISYTHMRDNLHQQFDYETQTPRDGNSKYAWKHSPENTAQPATGPAKSAPNDYSIDENDEDSSEEEWRPNRARAKAKAKAAAAASSTAAGASDSKTSASDYGKSKVHPTSDPTSASGGKSKANSDSKQKPTMSTPPKKAAAVDHWHELYDDAGNAYYFNERTGESKWEAPEWVEEIDPNSGASYYVKLHAYGAQPLHSTWSKPQQFAKLIRQAGANAAASASEDSTEPGPHHSSTIYEDEDYDDYGEIVEEDDLSGYHSEETQEVAEEVEDD